MRDPVPFVYGHAFKKLNGLEPNMFDNPTNQPQCVNIAIAFVGFYCLL